MVPFSKPIILVSILKIVDHVHLVSIGCITLQATVTTRIATLLNSGSQLNILLDCIRGITQGMRCHVDLIGNELIKHLDPYVPGSKLPLFPYNRGLSSTQVRRGLYTHYKDSVIKGGRSPIPNKTRLLTMAHIGTSHIPATYKDQPMAGWLVYVGRLLS